MTDPAPLQWPATAPAHGPVVLRPFLAGDVPVAMALSLDPYVPMIGTLPNGCR